MLVVDFDAPDRLRAFARFDADAARRRRRRRDAELLGRGHLALTIEQGSEASRYQGVVAARRAGRSKQAAASYFRSPSRFRPSSGSPSAQVVTAAGATGAPAACWRSSCRIPKSGAVRPISQPGDAPEELSRSAGRSEDDAWTEAKALAATVEDHELRRSRPCPSERLLYRLFHERGVTRLRAADRCATPAAVRDERVEAMLRSFSPTERDDMVGDDGMIGVTCEFCSTFRAFDPKDFDE